MSESTWAQLSHLTAEMLTHRCCLQSVSKRSVHSMCDGAVCTLCSMEQCALRVLLSTVSRQHLTHWAHFHGPSSLSPKSNKRWWGGKHTEALFHPGWFLATGYHWIPQFSVWRNSGQANTEMSCACTFSFQSSRKDFKWDHVTKWNRQHSSMGTQQPKPI